MDSTPTKPGRAVRSRDPPNRQDEGNKGNGQHTAGTSVGNRLDVFAKVGDDVERVYSNIDRGRLKTHSLLAAAMLSNTAAHGQRTRALTLSINPAEVTKDGLRYVLNGINNTNTDTKVRFNQSRSVALDIQIWAAVMMLELSASQGHFRHRLLNRISETVPDAETLTMCQILHQTDKAVYQRVVTRTAECLIDGTIDTVAGQRLLSELFPRLRQDVEKCVRKNRIRLAELAVTSKEDDGDYEAVENGLRSTSEDEVEQVKRGSRSY